MKLPSIAQVGILLMAACILCLFFFPAHTGSFQQTHGPTSELSEQKEAKIVLELLTLLPPLTLTRTMLTSVIFAELLSTTWFAIAPGAQSAPPALRC